MFRSGTILGSGCAHHFQMEHLTPDRVCTVCQTVMSTSWLNVIGSSCWKCKLPMLVAAVEPKDSLYPHVLGPHAFSPKELELAREEGVVIKEQYSHVTRERYLASTCTHCGNFTGQFYLFAHHYAPAHHGELQFIRLAADHYCAPCLQRSEEAEESLDRPGGNL